MDDVGRFRSTFLIEDNSWIKKNELNFLILRDNFGNEIKFPLTAKENPEKSNFSGSMWLNAIE